MEQEERLLKAIFSSDDERDENYPETTVEKVGYAECIVVNSLQNFSPALWRLSRLNRLLSVSEKDGKNDLPDIIADNELKMALKPLLLLENDIKDAIEILTEIYMETNLTSEEKS